MTQYSMVNQLSTNGSQVMLDLKNILIHANVGWTILLSSDGSVYDASDNWGNLADVANNYSWMLLESPDSAYQMIIQRGSADHYWAIGFLPATDGYFDLLTGSATGQPTATSGTIRYIAGSPTTYASVFYEYASAAKHHIVAFSTGEFWLGQWRIDNGSNTSMFIYDRIQNTDVSDTNLNAFSIMSYQTTSFSMSTLDTTSGLYTSLGSNWARFQTGYISGYSYNLKHGIGINSLTNKPDTFNGVLFRLIPDGGVQGYKGISSIVRYSGYVGLKTGNTVNITGTKSHVVVNNDTLYCILFPWDGTSDFQF